MILKQDSDFNKKKHNSSHLKTVFRLCLNSCAPICMIAAIFLYRSLALYLLIVKYFLLIRIFASVSSIRIKNKNWSKTPLIVHHNGCLWWRTSRCFTVYLQSRHSTDAFFIPHLVISDQHFDQFKVKSSSSSSLTGYQCCGFQWKQRFLCQSATKMRKKPL